MKNFIKNNYKFILGIFVGVLMSGISVYAAGELLASNIVYDNTTSGLTSTDVQSAINELNTKSNTWLNPNDMGTPTNYILDGTNKPTTSSPTTPPSGKNVYLGLYADSQYGVCIKRNGTQHCFRNNNWMAERLHVQEVFSDVSCSVSSANASCDALDFYCMVYSGGPVYCRDNGTNEGCFVYGDGSVECY